MKLTELFTAIKEENLDKYKLESYHKELSELYAEMHLQLADVKKKKALFLLNSTESIVATKRIAWDGSKDGLRETELKGYIKATSQYLRSLKTRMYNNY